jgi:phosphoserine phosphatase RsbU/P
MKRISFLRVRAFWRRLTLPDRIGAGIVLLDVLWRVASSLGLHPPLGSFIGFLFFVAIVYFAFRLLPWLRRKLLWSLRNRLIVAYLFIAVVPIVLLLAMAGVGSYMLYLQLGAHLFHDDLTSRLSNVEAVAETVADAVLREASPKFPPTDESLLSRPGVAAILETSSQELPGLRVELNHGANLLPRRESEEQAFQGIVEYHGKLGLRAVVAKSGSAGRAVVSAFVPVTPEMLDGLASELGPIQLTILRPVAEKDAQRFTFNIDGRDYVTSEQVSSKHRALGPPANWIDAPLTGGSTLDVIAQQGAEAEATYPVIATFLARPSQLNHRLFTSLGALGPKLTFALELIGITFLLLEVAALWTGVVLTRRITGAVSDLYEATRHVRRGDFGHRIHISQRDQLGVLSESFNEMTTSISELIEEQRQRQRLANEISIAREVQSQLFPQTLPNIPGVELAAICRAARTVSGDYYDFIRLGPTCLAIAVADISGKGISAALLMASLQAALRSQALLDGRGSTAQLVARLNQHLFHNTSDDRYATFFYAVYDSATRILAYTNAGHLAPFYVEGEKIVKLDTGGTVVGLFDQCEYAEGKLQVAPGSLLVAFSDGLTEPENVYGEEFGGRRLMEEVLRHRDASPQRLAETLIDSAEQWGSTPEQADDMTIVVARLG